MRNPIKFERPLDALLKEQGGLVLIRHTDRLRMRINSCVEFPFWDLFPENVLVVTSSI